MITMTTNILSMDWAILTARLTITGVQAFVINNNNDLSKETGLERIFLISKQGKF